MKLKKIFLGVVLVFALLPNLSLAAPPIDTTCTPEANNQGLCNPVGKVGGSTFQSFGIHVLQVFAGAVGTVTIIYVTFSGFRFLISQGNSEEVETAKRSLQWSLSGLVVLILSYVLISAISSFFKLQPIPGPEAPTLTNPIAAKTFNDLYLLFINGFFEIVGLIAVLIIIINGVRYMTARGNEEQAESARSGLQYAVLGVIIILFAYVLVRATATFFGAR